MKRNSWYPVFYMFVLTAFFSFIVIGLASLTHQRVEINKKQAFERAVLSCLPGQYDPALTDLQLHRRFIEKLSEPDNSSGGAYTIKEKDTPIAYALPISGRGFWAPIKGIIGIAADKKTITGIVFYEQNETPGLGAQMTTSDFRDQFKGKVLADTDRPLNIKRPGEKLGPHDVHAVTGATQTSNRLEILINNCLKIWRTKITENKSSGTDS